MPFLHKGPRDLYPQQVLYHLFAHFNAPNQGYANAQVLNRPLEGVQQGSLTIVELDGTLAIVGEKCAFTLQGTPNWNDLGITSTTAITKALGTTLLVTINMAISTIGWDLGFDDNPVLARYHSYGGTSSQRIWINIDGQSALWRIDMKYLVDTDQHLAIVLGGFDVNGVPWRAGEPAASYLYGAGFWTKGGNYPTWSLLCRDYEFNTTPLYFESRLWTAAGTFDNIRVPDRDLSAVLQPACFSTFTAANGTSLDAITPEVGGTWTEQVGDWDIQSNRADGPGTARATVDPSTADVVIQVIANGAGVAPFGISARYSDANHEWLIGADDSDNELQIWQNNTGWTKRASTAVAVAQATDYHITAHLHGQTIQGFLDRANAVIYTSAAMNETETQHGLYSGNIGDRFDNFVIWPFTSSVYDRQLDAV